jgi:hypothetical protein
MSITKAILAILVVLGSASLAQAQEFDPNLANRYPAYAEPSVHAGAAHSLQSRDVALPQATLHSSSDAWMDRASQSFSGGGY